MHDSTISKKIIGIDIGTTNSCIAVMEKGKPVVIPNAEGARTTPSAVAFTEDGQLLVGASAKAQASTNMDGTFFLKKANLGLGEEIRVGDSEFSSSEIDLMLLQNLLKKLKSDAESYLGEEVTEVVLGVPIYRGEEQSVLIKEAAKGVGLQVVRMVNEAILSALAYGFEHPQDQKILLFDLGGGSLSVGVFELGEGVVETIAVAGDNLGGNDFDEVITEHIVKDFKKREGVDLSKDKAAMQRIREVAEKGKIELSSVHKTYMQVPHIAETSNGWKHVAVRLTRERYEELTADLLKKAAARVTRVLVDAGISGSHEKLQSVLVTGAATRIPAIQKMLEEKTGTKVSFKLNPTESIALGAAIQAAKLAGEEATKNILMLDVIPASLSIETKDGIATKVIHRNSTIPTKKILFLSTESDNQEAVDISILKGERQFAKDNRLVGIFRLAGILPAAKEKPLIKVTLDLDLNLGLTVAAVDLNRGIELEVTRFLDHKEMPGAPLPFIIKEMDEDKIADKDLAGKNGKEVEGKKERVEKEKATDDSPIKIFPFFEQK